MFMKLTVVMIVICIVCLFTVNLLVDEQQDNFQAPESEDFSSLTWSKAFDKLHAKFSREYGLRTGRRLIGRLFITNSNPK